MGEQRRADDEPLTTTLIAPLDAAPSLPKETEAVTPDHLPNVVIQVINPLLVLTIRTAKVYVNTIVGLMAAGMTTNVIPYHDFLELLQKSALLALSAAGMTCLMTLVELLNRLDQKFPTWTA